MSKSAGSIFYFGIYLVVLGLSLTFFPNAILRMFGFPETQEVWLSVAGLSLLFLGFYYIQAGRHDLRAFFPWTLYTRPTVILFFTALVLLDLAEPTLVLFGLVDLLGAIWTYFALRADRRAVAS